MRACALALLVLLASACSGDDSTTPSVSAVTSTTRPAGPVLTIASLNVLHGATCTDNNQHCDAPDRVALLAHEITTAGCPDVVALQVVAPWMHDLLTAQLPKLCGARYKEQFAPGDGIDGLSLLVDGSRFTVREPTRVTLSGGHRAAMRSEIDTSIGRVAIVNTHAGTGADDMGEGGNECAEDATQCRPPCDANGSMFACQLVQLRQLAADAPAAVIAGDLNLVPRSPLLRTLTGGGYVDSYLAAGNPECDAGTGIGCTSGRIDFMLDVLKDATAKDNVRVDYVFVRNGTACVASFGPGTKLWADRPAADGPGGLAWVSDHVGTALDLRCR
jgi:endonuclease/exonuclease/phosphatase family metal-dependent hydrolase